MRITRQEFEKLVEGGVRAIPEKFLRLLDNVAIVIEERPTPEQRKKLHLHNGVTLFGLYEGVPQARRGSGYSGVPPDKISIFMEPILGHIRSEEDVKKIVMETVWHEIAHHFGMNEEEVARAEKKRRIQKTPQRTAVDH